MTNMALQYFLPSDCMLGYRDGVIEADKDVQHFDKLGGIDARQEHIKCPPIQ